MATKRLEACGAASSNLIHPGKGLRGDPVNRGGSLDVAVVFEQLHQTCALAIVGHSAQAARN